MCNLFLFILYIYIYIYIFFFCFRSFPFLFLWLSLCQLYSHTRVPYAVCDSNILNYQYFSLLLCALYTWSETFGPSALFILAGNPNISFRDTFFVLIYLWVRFYHVLYCTSCPECYFYLCFFKNFYDFLCFSSTTCKVWRTPNETYGMPTT
jgi:hypothetical protein